MPIKKVSECDVCGKTELTDVAVESYFIHNIVHVYCSQGCFEKSCEDEAKGGVSEEDTQLR